MSIRIAVPKRKTQANTPVHTAVANGETSGLTSITVRPYPLIFGSASFQERLLKIARYGASPTGAITETSLIVTSGIFSIQHVDKSNVIALNVDHPAFPEIRTMLSDMLGVDVDVPVGNGNGEFDRLSPLGHKESASFRMMLVFIQANTSLDEEAVRRRLPDIWPGSVTNALDRLTRDHVLVEGEERTFALSSDLPPSFKTLVLRLAELIDDPRLLASDAAGKRAAAYQQPSDGAPRLFGTDARLRNLMALAVHGPMLYRDLRRITGAYHLHEEGRDEAPFSRAALARTWGTPDGTAVMLDDLHPLALPLKRLLVRLSEIYPLPPHVPAFGRPDPPPTQAWDGDRLALFGSPIPTKILLTLGNRGWTFEAICCESASGSRDKNSNKRVVTKKVVRRLEDEGILAGSRPRGPGFGPRLLVIPESFLAKDELYALIDAAMMAWPDLAGRVQAEFGALPAKTKEYFRRRGLWADERPLD